MKRKNHIHKLICTPSNIELADDIARRGKHNWGIIKHDKRRAEDNAKLLQQLKDNTYTTSEYDVFTIKEPKERTIYRLPYYPDRITHHAIMNILEPIWKKIFIKDTYACIKERGIHSLATNLQKLLRKDVEGTKYCLKLDIKKYYPSVDHDILKEIIRYKIKDKEVLSLLDEIIDSTNGIPIGNYISQYFSNLYLSYFDHWILEEIKPCFKQQGITLYYKRYADDMVLLSNNKDKLKEVLILIKLYLKHKLKLQVKDNYQVFPVESRGIDFVGYVFYHTHTLIRKNIKKSMFKHIKYQKGEELKTSLQSYNGWLKYCNSKTLLSKVEHTTNLHYSNWNGEKAKISDFYNKNIRIIEIILHNKYFYINFVHNKKSFSVKSKNKVLYNTLCSTKLPTNYIIKDYVKRKQN